MKPPVGRGAPGHSGAPYLEEWTGRTGAALRGALRMSLDEFSEYLGLARRTAAGWQERPDAVLRAETQRLLDTVYERATSAQLARFEHLLSAAAANAATVLPAGNDALRLLWADGSDLTPEEATALAKAILSDGQDRIGPRVLRLVGGAT